MPAASPTANPSSENHGEVPEAPSIQQPAGEAHHEGEHERQADRAQLADRVAASAASGVIATAPSVGRGRLRTPPPPPPRGLYWRLPGSRMVHLRRLLAVGAAAALLWPSLLDAQARERVAYVTVVDRSPAASRSPSCRRRTSSCARTACAREVLRVTRATGPMLIAVLVDNSSAAEPAFPTSATPLTRFLTGLGDLGPVTLVTMAERPTIVTDYTSNPALLSAGVSRIFSPSPAASRSSTPCSRPADGLLKREGERAAIVLRERTGRSSTARCTTRGRWAGSSNRARRLHAVISQSPGRAAFTDAARQRDSLFDRGVRETGGSVATS